MNGIDAVLLQKRQELAGGMVRLPRRGDTPGDLFADAIDFGQPVRIGFDDRQGVGLEVVDEPVHQLAAHTRDESGFQVSADAVHGGR